VQEEKRCRKRQNIQQGNATMTRSSALVALAAAAAARADALAAFLARLLDLRWR
jgi:hypothetical protein